MKVKIGNKVYAEQDGPIMIILTKADKRNLSNMHKEATKYCQYDEHCNSKEEIEEFMNEPKD